MLKKKTVMAISWLEIVKKNGIEDWALSWRTCTEAIVNSVWLGTVILVMLIYKPSYYFLLSCKEKKEL